KRERVNCTSILCLLAPGAKGSNIVLMLACPALAQCLYCAGLDLHRLCRRAQQCQGFSDIAFEIKIRLQVLIDHVLLERMIVDRDDLAAWVLLGSRARSRAASSRAACARAGR